MGWLSAFSHSQGSEGSESSADSGVHVAGVSPVEPGGVGCCPRHDSSALRSGGKVEARHILASAPTDRNLCHFQALGCQTTHSNQEVLQNCLLVFFATKPHVLPTVLAEVAPLVTAEHILVSVAAGVSLSTLEEVCAFSEALAEGAIKMGMPGGLAHRIAAQTLLGTAKMLQQNGQHPAQLRTDVCTPGGTTIYGLHALEQGGLRAAAMSAVEAATCRARELSGK
ncbi:pyrroline-5-carboxylate reductase 3 isoform X3 [Mustela erminea]|uniref:pyrroline-5-carboxylate reductase 3 isoform X3 n=1 Tax=Mustela erminea TaxID=36723 RepID=UPI00138702CD|nr:pyrroline-5-carboxylate reductase 3 isoform X3 [Mustela erminea]